MRIEEKKIAKGHVLVYHVFPPGVLQYNKPQHSYRHIPTSSLPDLHFLCDFTVQS